MTEVFPHVKSGTVLWMLKDSIDFKPVHGLMNQTVLTHILMTVIVPVVKIVMKLLFKLKLGGLSITPMVMITLLLKILWMNKPELKSWLYVMKIKMKLSVLLKPGDVT
jgi:hypothetical protein